MRASSTSSRSSRWLPQMISPGRSRILREPPPGFIAPALHEGDRSNDRDLLERIEREEIGVAGDDQIGMPTDGQFQKLVVLWIATNRDSLGDRDQLCRR
jgi:hypothetical protein